MSNAVDITAIDLALATHYSGMSINTGVDEDGAGGSSTPVSVFLEDPFPELYRERVYPSINLKLISVLPNFEEYHSDDEDTEEVDYDDTVTPHETVMRQKPLPYQVIYSLDTWHKVRVIESRDLLKEAVFKKTKPRSYLTVKNIDDEDTNLWFFTDGSIAQRDEYYPDMVIYHKVMTLTVLAHLSSVNFDDTVREKVVMTVNWKAIKRMLQLRDFEEEIIPAGEITHLDWDYDETEEGPA